MWDCELKVISILAAILGLGRLALSSEAAQALGLMALHKSLSTSARCGGGRGTHRPQAPEDNTGTDGRESLTL